MTTKEAVVVAAPAAVKPPRPNKEDYQKVNRMLLEGLESPLVAKVVPFHSINLSPTPSSCLIQIPSPSLVNGATDRENHCCS